MFVNQIDKFDVKNNVTRNLLMSAIPNRIAQNRSK